MTKKQLQKKRDYVAGYKSGYRNGYSNHTAAEEKNPYFMRGYHDAKRDIKTGEPPLY